MTFRSPEHVQLEEIAGRLVESLGECDENALPSVDGVISFACDVREVLFPGYGKTRRLPAAEQQAIETAALLNRIESRLRIETGRSILHARQTMLKLHSDTAEPPAVHGDARSLARQFLTSLPELQAALKADIQAAFDGDPAARSSDEIVLSYPGIEAVLIYRVAHKLHQLGIPYLPRILTEWAHGVTGIDIHPGATIGPRFFIDHGTGVVIGETCEIGAGVTLYQGVTLGAWSFPRDEDGNLIRGEKRHPTLEDNVSVYSNATILGGTTVIGAGSLVGANVVLSRSVMPNTIVTIEKPSLRFREAG
ncbi:serine O-acetyltransferase EpsC [Fuerstiella marisgermanici]|uniref:Serine acetyltransferase n=1 Tax=Fuerstiella marisgermanici TaxID=1891926 RepID=A0A1P8WAV9_9PLAN|nr:serine O-acetyltransferase EpsC [Fuerstiella marisgermanici]APZ91184.1 Serine acetyltransferase [Fuerstiella marisgermanici]